MDNFIKNLEIKNFKSIKHLALDCKRVNVFIGKPNVGKSNILEAMGLFSSEFFAENLGDLIRMKKIDDLFFDFFLSDKISIKLNNKLHLTLSLKNERSDLAAFLLTIYEDNTLIESIPLIREGLIKWKESNYIKNVFTKYYRFSAFEPKDAKLKGYLCPPFGENLFEIVTNYREIRSRIVAMLKEQNLEFVSLINERDFKLQKNIDGFVTQYPYSSIADTFQRFIFYLAAIESNKDAVLIFEEPEVHSFPPYVKELAERIAYKKENQFFISTHSPYLLNTLISRLDSSELTIFLTYYKDYQTFVKPLSEESIQEVRDLGVDVFFNLDRF